MQLSGDSGRDRAYQYLRGTVLSDPAVSGTFINEQAVATEVGISRTPVREALLMLAAEDLVQLVPHRGAFVAPVPGREIAEMMQARGVIETWAATTCLALNEAPVAPMSAVLDQQRAIVENGDAKEFIELDSQFHALLVEAAGNSVLGQAVRQPARKACAAGRRSPAAKRYPQTGCLAGAPGDRGRLGLG